MEEKDEEREYNCSTTLVITGDKLDPDKVTKLLKLIPNQSWKKNQKRVFSSGNEYIYKWGGWKLFISDEKRELYLEEQLKRWYKLLKLKRKQLYYLANQGYWVCLDCYISTDATASICFDLKLQRKMIKLGVDLTFNIFSSQSDPD